MPPPPQVSFTPGEYVCEVFFTPKFKRELRALQQDVIDECYVKVELLEQIGHKLDRPHAGPIGDAGTIKDVRELRFTVNRVEWRAMYVFYNQQAVMLSIGDKAGFADNDRFYDRLKSDGVKAWNDWQAREAAGKKRKKR